MCTKNDSKLRKEKVFINPKFLGAVMLFQHCENATLVASTLMQCHINNGTPVTKTTPPAQYITIYRHMPQLNDMHKVAINEKQRRGDYKTLLLLWACN